MLHHKHKGNVLLYTQRIIISHILVQQEHNRAMCKHWCRPTVFFFCTEKVVLGLFVVRLLSLYSSRPHMSACRVSPPPLTGYWFLYRVIRYLLSLEKNWVASSPNTSQLHSLPGSGCWAEADTFLLTITSHTGRTFRLLGPLGFFSIHFHNNLRPMGPSLPHRAYVFRGHSH